MNTNCHSILPVIQKDFGALWHCRKLGETLEIVTPFSTVSKEFVTVFITCRNNELIVSDGGWMDYNALVYQVPGEIIESDWKVLVDHFAETFGVRLLLSGGKTFYYKKAASLELLSAAIYDVAQFVSGTLAAFSSPQEPEIETEYKETFRQKANGYFNKSFASTIGSEGVRFRFRLEDLKGVSFSAALIRSNQISLFNYVTGSTNQYFMHDLRRAIVNFELSEKSKYRSAIKHKIALINNEADGYSGMQNNQAFGLLKEHAEIVSWTDRDALMSSF